MTKKILIVDDETINLEEVSEALNEEGYECLIANNVDVALNIVRNTPDLTVILTDLKMPNKSGVDLINAVKMEFERDIKFLIMSGHGSTSLSDEGSDLSHFPFIGKPLNIDQLIKETNSLFDRKGINT